MSDDFKIQVSADLDTSDLEQKLKNLGKDRKIKIGIELDKSAEEQAKDLSKSIERGLKSTKIDSSNLSKQLADSFNISDKNIVNKLQKQINSMLGSLSKTWNGKNFDLGKATGFYDGIDKMAQTISKNAKLIQNKMGIYDQFYSYFKDKKIYISDALKSAMGNDLYKEISNANIGKIVRDATKGVSIDSIWGEMSDLFPEHFSKNITNQVDQVVKAFDVLKAARADVAKTISFADMKPEQQLKVTDSAYANVVDAAHQMVSSLQKNISSASDALKTEFQIDVKVNTDNIRTDIQEALNQASTAEPIKVNLDLNKGEIESQVRTALDGISSSETPINIKLNVSRQSLEADLQSALNEIDLPVKFNIDVGDIEKQIREAVSSIDDIQLDVHINTDAIRDDIKQQTEQNPVNVRVQTDNNATDSIKNLNRAGQEGQTIFSALGGSVKEAFQTFTLADIIQDGIYEIFDAGKEGIQTVKELDDAMLDLQMATGDSKSKVQEMMQDYNNLGQELGALTTEVSSSADTWLRQGKSIDETNKLIKDSMVLSKVGQITSENSSEILTATLNGFQMAADQAEHVNDVLSSIDIASASSVEGIGTALTKTASMAHNAGISLEKTAAMIASIKDVTQDSDSSIGNSINSILSRLNNVKAGKFVDSEAGEALNDVEKVLGKLNISMRDTNNQFLSSETIIDNVAARWNTFDDTAKRAVATAMAGTRNYNKLVAMFDNYDKVQKLTAIANNSDGAAQSKFANYEQSLEAKTKSLQASMEALASDTLSGEMYAGFLDAAKGMADFAKETDLVKTALAGLGTAGATYAFTQLSTMLSNTITQVANLGGGLRGLWGVLSAHPVALVTAGVTAAIGVWNAYRASVDEAVNSAKQAGDTWEQSNTSIQDNISRITELRTALDSGTLTEQEAYDTKSQLLDIQNQLSESYGSQAEGIDLVNGSLDEQIAKLKELNTQQSNQFLNENRKGIEEAQKQMEKERSVYLGQAFKNGTPEYKAITDSISKINKKYGKELFTLNDSMDGTTVDIHLKADASEGKQALNDFMTEIQNAQSQIGESNLLSDIMDNASAGLNDFKNVLEEYQDLYIQSMKADIQTNKKQYGGKTSADWLNNYAKAVENYNNAVSGGNAQEINDARVYYQKINQSVQSLLKGSDMSQYSTLFQDIADQLDTASIKAQEFNAAISGEGTNGFQKHLKSVVDEIKSMNLSDVDLKIAINSGDTDSINYLSKAAQDAGISTDQLAQALVDLGVVSGQPSSELDQTTASIDSLTTSTTTLLSQINAVNSALSSQATGQSIDVSTFDSEELENYHSALEYVNGSMQLNIEKVKELNKAKADEQITANNAKKAELQATYLQQAGEIEKLNEKLREANFAQGENADTIKASIDSYMSANEEIVAQCDKLDLLNSSLREATGAYQEWLNAQNTSESGDMFDDSLNAIQAIRDTANADSEDYGKIGTKKYKAAVDFVIPDTVDIQDENAVQSYLNSIEQYFMHNDDGERTGLDLSTFLNSAVEKGLMTVDESGNDFQLAGQMTMEKFAEGMNMSLPMVQAFFGELQEYGGQFDWTDEAVQTIGDLGIKANEAAESLKNISGNEDLKINLDVSDIDTTKGKISALDDTIAQMNALKAKPNVDVSEIENANAIIQYCVAQEQQLSGQIVMSVDTSQVDGALGQAISLLQEFWSAQTQVKMQASVEADTSEAQSKVDGLVGEIQGLTPEIKAQLGIDASSEASITTSIQSLTPEILVKAGVDDKAIQGYKPDDKDATVKYDKDSSIPDNYKPSDKNAIVRYNIDTSRPASYIPSNKTAYIDYYTRNHGSNSNNGNHGVNGTAHASGTAKVGGDWGAKKGGKVLVGELGREIMVDPYTGKWRSIGDNGAEFVDVPKGAIIFNHKQAESLLERGWVNGRGVTAFASGTAMVTGGINIAHIRQNSSSTSSSNTTAQNANTRATQENTTAKQENTDSAKESTQAFDWIKRVLDKFSKNVERIANQITDYVSSAVKISLLKKEITAVDKQISANMSAYNAYMNKANSVDISSDYKNRVMNGTFSIEEIDTSTDAGKKLAEDIQKFQDYYDSAMDCSDAITELNNKHLELFETLANMPTEKAEKAIDKLKNKYESLSAVQDTVSTGGSAIANLQKQINADNPNINKYYKAKATKTTTEQKLSSASKTLKTEKSDLSKSGSTLVQASQDQTNSIAKQLRKVAKSSTSKTTYNAIAKAIREGKPINLKGLKGNVLAEAKAWNASLKQQNYIESKVKSGKGVSTSKVSKSLRDEAKSYNSDVKSKDTAQQNYNKAKTVNDKAQKTYSTLYNTVKNTSTAEQRMISQLKTGTKEYKIQNKLLDLNLKLTKQEAEYRKKAVQEATKDTQALQKKKTKADASFKQTQNFILKNKGFQNALSSIQKEAVKAGKTVSTKGITDPNILNGLNKYNNQLSTCKTLNKELTIQINAQSEAVKNLGEIQAEVAQQEIENEKQKLDNISNYYDAIMSQYADRNNIIESKMSALESKGYNLSTTFYQAEISNEKSTLKNLKAQKSEMEKSFQNALNNGTIQAGTTDFYDMRNAINSVAQSIAESESNIASFEAKIRDLKWEQFDRFEDSIKRIASESDFLINLMSTRDMYDKETAKLTSEGMATMGLHGVNYNTYMSQADNYKKEMLNISAQLAKDPNNQKLIDRKNELVDAQQQAILSAENEKQAIKDLISDGIQAELDNLDDLIDKYLKLLEAKKDLYDYERKISKQADNIASLQKQLAAYQNDTSEEAKSKIQQISVNLKEAKEDLKADEYDKFISDQKELLDNLRQDYEDVLNKRLDNIDILIQTTIDQINANASDIQQTLTEQANNVGYTMSDEMTKIWTVNTDTNGKTESIATVLSTYSANFSSASTTVNDTIKGVWNRQEAMQKSLESQAQSIISAIKDSTTTVQGFLDEEKTSTPKYEPEVVQKKDTTDFSKVTIEEINDTPKKTNTKKNTNINKNTNTKTSKNLSSAKVGDKVIFDNGNYYGSSDGSGRSGKSNLNGTVYITKISSGSTYPYHISTGSKFGSGDLGWVKLNQLKHYATGGHVDKDQWAFVNEDGQELIKYEGGTLIPLPGGGDVINAEKTKILLEKLSAPQMMYQDMVDNLMNSLNGARSARNEQNTTHIENLNLTLPGIRDGEELVNYLIKSPRLQNAIEDMTINRLSGRSNSLSKFKYIK